MVNNDRFLFFENIDKVYVDHNLFELNIEPEYSEIACALLNSSFTALNRELISRMNLGDGATKTEGIDWSNNVFMINYKNISNQDVNRILKLYKKIKNRKIYSIDKEVKQKDRIALDRAILKAIKLDPDEYLTRIYQGLIGIVKERLSLPKLRKKIKSKKVETSVELIKKQVEEEVVPNGLREFPESFLLSKKKLKFKEIQVNGKFLKIGKHFFGSYEIVDVNNEIIYTADSYDIANYIINANKIGEYIISIPNSKIDITKAIIKYEKYIKDTYKKIVKRAFMATHDHNISDRLVLEILIENGYKGNFELE